jgi:hypothetical protein
MKIAADVVDDHMADAMTASTWRCELMASAERSSEVKQLSTDDSNFFPRAEVQKTCERLNGNKEIPLSCVSYGKMELEARLSSGENEIMKSDRRRSPDSAFDDLKTSEHLLLNPEAKSLALGKADGRGDVDVDENFTGTLTNSLTDRNSWRVVDSMKGEADERVSTNTYDDKILVERSGKFLFVNVSELTSSEKNLYTVEKSPSQKKLPKKLVSKSDCSVMLASGRVMTSQVIAKLNVFPS